MHRHSHDVRRGNPLLQLCAVEKERPHIVTVVAGAGVADRRLDLPQDDRLHRDYALVTTATTQRLGAESVVDEKPGIDQMLTLPPFAWRLYVVRQE